MNQTKLYLTAITYATLHTIATIIIIIVLAVTTNGDERKELSNMVVEVPEMDGWVPVVLKGNYTVKVRDCKESENGGGFTLYLEVIEGPKGESNWVGQEIRAYVHTNFDSSKYEQSWIDGWMKNLYLLCKATGVDSARIDTDEFIGKEIGVKLGPDKEKVNTEVKSWIPAK